ncbi:MAG: hypothetical protein V3R66_06685 [Rhodospirillales bacterium]
MAEIISYELYAYKGGKWVIDSVYDDKQQALHEGRILLESRHLTGVKIIQENYDKETDKTSAMIIFNEAKNVEKVRHKPVKPIPKAGAVTTAPAPRVRPKKEGDFTKYIVKLVVILGGLMLGGVALVAYYMASVGD